VTVWAVGSLRGAPGATTLAMGLAAAWPATTGRRCVVVEADPNGGVLAARFDELRADRTIADAAVALRREVDIDRLLATARPVWGAVPVIPCHPSAEQTTAVLVNAADRLATGLAGAFDVDAIADVGRLVARSPALPLARRAVATLLLSGTRFEDVAILATRVRELRAAGVEPFMVAVGDAVYDPEDVAREADLPLFAVLPHDPRSAAALVDGTLGDGRLRRSLLWRTICEAASRLLQMTAPPVTDGGELKLDVDLREEVDDFHPNGRRPEVTSP
jgi:hypothetical protein